ncbi:MAG: formimidoylglutamate deiminase [Pseudotabrizicola sp.]|uniref:formimidoylglutamate deiminase n=1 Tax=Pseudotabrizicola sp. TaxID=2939647 RepID=UPI0027239048|nr:formimidoylglutamate deiminase [Pseudotabrizicola sp.]MDO8883475.1 formimidoylglutamate deiminase [Pseudotabrizicola sp.]MDP2082513.1 formimidoylglutamate deiminase [Pseudotabrizicola sp.]MDZ7573976.1 formimidoylglutamate deiminase [Pseudotabrizicola sp.]
MSLHAKTALLPDGWARNVRLTLASGQIASVTQSAPPQPGDHRAEIVIPGLPNLHSHAFQRGFSGLTEQRGPSADSFWTWRETMYRFALTLTPEAMQAIAALAYIEMLESGYTRVGEFHYLHHAHDGRPYDNPAEMSERIFAAASETGIALTHLPVFYAHGGFGPQSVGQGQRRFLHGLDAFARLIEASDELARPQDRVGLAPHSLRAATMADITTLASGFANRPLHIHISEQVKEVEDCLAHSGQRPVEYLLSEAPVGPDWCLIHATHLTGAEVQGIAASRAVVGLCPITEANLGDGIFPAQDFLAAGGRIGLGTDSNVEITAAGEVRMLEYSQRLGLRARNVCADHGSTGARLFHAAASGGAQALGAPLPQISTGAPADLVALQDSMMLDMADDRLLDRWIFGRDLGVTDVWANGVHLVQQGRHIARDQIVQTAAKACRALI